LRRAPASGATFFVVRSRTDEQRVLGGGARTRLGANV
jgi:hypothetical protein